MQRRFIKHHGKRRTLFWAHRILRCYPRAWRERYADELVNILQEYPLSLWTLLDLLLGALDAHLHPDLLPQRMITMTARIRTSEIVIFCTYIFYGCLWFIVDNVRDPLSVWERIVQVHPAILLTDFVVNAAGGIALLALVGGGIPILLGVLHQALQARQWRQLGLLAMPIVALVLLVAYSLLAEGAWTQRTIPQNPDGPLTPLAIILQLGFLLLLLAAIIGSTAAVAIAVGRSQVSERLLRFALLAATVVTLAMVVGTGAALLLTLLILTQAPQLAVTTPAIMPVFAILMGLAAALAVKALQQGRRAARQQVAADRSS